MTATTSTARATIVFDAVGSGKGIEAPTSHSLFRRPWSSLDPRVHTCSCECVNERLHLCMSLLLKVPVLSLTSASLSGWQTLAEACSNHQAFASLNSISGHIHTDRWPQSAAQDADPDDYVSQQFTNAATSTTVTQVLGGQAPVRGSIPCRGGEEVQSWRVTAQCGIAPNPAEML